MLCSITLNIHSQEEKVIQAKLKEATVFFHGAELTHEATVSLQKGNNDLRITGLSHILDVSSIKIKTSSCPF